MGGVHVGDPVDGEPVGHGVIGAIVGGVHVGDPVGDTHPSGVGAEDRGTRRPMQLVGVVQQCCGLVVLGAETHRGREQPGNVSKGSEPEEAEGKHRS